MAGGWSTKIISMIKWIRTSRLSIKNSLWWQVGIEACPSTTVVALEAGGTSACVRLSTGETKCWGGNAHGQLGYVADLNSASASTTFVKLQRQPLS